MRVIWITGLSGSGKSTLAQAVVDRLREKNESVVMLDGDELREVFGAVAINSRNHSYEGRLALARQYSRLCKVIASQGVTVVIATISLFQEVHEWNRLHLPGYYEVYLKVAIEELRRRDPKGIYKLFDDGKLTSVAGMDLQIDEPTAPDWIVEFNFDKPVVMLAEELLEKTNLI